MVLKQLDIPPKNNNNNFNLNLNLNLHTLYKEINQSGS